MKHTKVLFLVVALLMAGLTFVVAGPNAKAATDATDITVNLDVNATIAIDCTDTVTMGAITGTGQSALATNEASCNIKTNNTDGYKLEWQASAATMTNATSDTIAAYTPASAGTPETWSVAAADSEWGAKLKSTSTDYVAGTWGAADTYAGGKWLNVDNAAAFEIASRSTETAQAGSDEVIVFGAEVGANKWQPTGTYTVDVTMTATTL